METQDILRFGVAFVGLVLIIGAINNLHTGYTFGLTGKGKFYRKDEPGYFMVLFLSRIFLGLVCLAAVYFAPA
ncbi:MAG: hypothetical protein WBS20_07795 [Lysobacterales bacterium]